jgi:cell division protein FtsI (penicillin-binding protein 3)
MAAKRRHEWGRLVVVACGVASLFAVVAIRAGQLTVVRGRRLAQLAHQQQHREVNLLPRRGPIVDRRGELLALTIDAESLYANPRFLRAEPEKLEPLARALDLPTDELLRKAAADGSFVWLKRLASPREVTAARAMGVPGVETTRELRRVYPRAPLAAHVLGVAGIDAQGLEGVEWRYDALILPPARNVLAMNRDAHGRPIFTDGLVRPDAPVGARVELTLDATFQTIAERELERGVAAARARAGSVVVLDPQTGAVLALANVPTFDANSLATSEAAARRNRAIADVYEPGSTLKAMLAAAALDQGVITPERRVFCEDGRYRIGRNVIHDRPKREWLTFAEVVQYSSNIGTVKVAEALGAERLHAYLEGFGFGTKTGVGLPAESDGQLRPVGSWKAIDLATASFGQGVAVTPLQLARAFAVIANGGELVRPYVVRRVVGADGTVLVERTPTVLRRVIRPETAARVVDLLRGAVEGDGGTGQLARIEGVAVAGKTGTAQKVDPETRRYSPTARVASFVGFVPADAPQFVIVVVIDEPTTSPYGGRVAAPVFRQIAAAMLGRVGVETGERIESERAKRGEQVQEVHGRGGAGGAGDFVETVRRAGQRRPGARA